MSQLVRVLRAYLIAAGVTGAGLVAYHIILAYHWMRVPENFVQMSPVLQANQTFRVDQRPMDAALLDRGTIVAYLKDPRQPDSLLLGRVVARPGERVSIHKGEILLNGARLSESGMGATDGEVPEIIVPRGHLFLLVDQRTGRGEWEDSRTSGPVSTGRLLGRVVR